MEMNAAPSSATLSEKDRAVVKHALSCHVENLTKKAKQLRDLGEEEIAKGLELKCVYVNERIAPAFAEQLDLNLGVHDEDAAPRPEPGTAVVHVHTVRALLKPGKPPKKKKPGKKK